MQLRFTAFRFCSFSLTILFVISSLTAFAQTSNQWRALAPLEGGNINALASAEGRVYAVTQARNLYVSSDNGQTWRTSTRGLEGQQVSAVVALEGAAIAVSSSTLYRSTDGGLTWASLGVTPRFVFALAHSGANLLAIQNSGQAFLSTDKGQTWTARGTLPSGTLVRNLAISGETAVAGTFSGIWQSPDLGMTWSNVRTGLPNSGAPSVSALAAHDDKFYLGTLAYGSFPNYEPQVWVSSDKGQTWTGLGTAFTITAGDGSFAPPVNGLAFDGTFIFAATTRGIAVYDGNDWSELLSGRGYPVGLQGQTLTRMSDTLFCGTATGGVLRWVKDTSSWQMANIGLHAANVVMLAANESSLFASTGGAGLWRSNDDGQSWTPLNLTQPGGLKRPLNVTRLAVKGTQVFAGTDTDGALYSRDNGTTWRAINQGFFLPTSTIFDLVAANDKVYCLQGASLYRFDETAQEWTRLTPSSVLAIRLAASERGLYGAWSTGVQRSTDGGQSFQLVATPDMQIGSLVAARGKQVFFSGFAAGVAPRLFVSANEGESYQRSNASFYATAFGFKDEFVYAASLTSGFYFSLDGLNWTAANAGLNSITNLTALVIRGNTTFIGTSGAGVYAAVNPHTQVAGALANANAASYSTVALAPASIAAAFGSGLTLRTEVNQSAVALPTTLAGLRVFVRDGAGHETNAGLFFASPSQINYLVPTSAMAGNGSVRVMSGENIVAFSNVTFAAIAPGLFAANATGQGPAAALALRVKADGSQVYESIAELDPATNRYVTRPLDLGPENEMVFLVAFGTGFRNVSGLANVTSQIGGTDAPVTYAGIAPGLIGVDQANIRLPRSLAGRGEIEVRLTVDGKSSNAVTLRIR